MARGMVRQMGRWSLFLATLACAGAAHALVGNADVVELRGPWQCRWTSLETSALSDSWDNPAWHALQLPQRAAPQDEVLWMRIHLPQGTWRDPALRLDSVLGNFEVYVDDQRVLAHPKGGLATPGVQGTGWHLVALPANAGGRVLTLRVRVTYRPGGVRGVPVLGERAEHLAWATRVDLPRVVVGCFLLMMAVMVLVALARRKDWRMPVGYALATATLGVHVLFHTYVRDMLGPSPRLWLILWAVAVPFHPVGQLLFLDELFGTGPKGLLRRLLRIHFVYALALILVDLVAWGLVTSPHAQTQKAGALLFGGFNLTLRGLMLVTTVGVVWVVGSRARRGEMDARIWLVGFLAYIITVLDALVTSFGLEHWQWTNRTHLGALGLSAALAFILQRRYTELNRRVAAYATELQHKSREKELMLRDLHDGVGGLTTNIRMLAELGAGNQDRARQALRTIFELSGKTLAELRAFVQTLDELGVDWPAMASELRRFGAQVLEGSGRAFRMDVTLHSAPAPSSMVCLNVLRIFREALTNALKHCSDGEVVVEFHVDAMGLQLAVENPNPSAEQPRPATLGMDTHRGLNNMRARALEMGGTLEVHVGTVTRVELSVPHPNQSPETPPPARFQMG